MTPWWERDRARGFYEVTSPRGTIALPWPGTMPEERKATLEYALSDGILTQAQVDGMSTCVTDIANADPAAWDAYVRTFEKQQ